MARLPYLIPYDPTFLGAGFSVPLPVPDGSEAGRALLTELLGEGTAYDYIHYSLVVHAARRQTLFTACNLDGDLQKQATRGSWSIDNRLADYQIGNEAYRDTPGNPNAWDRGHLVRRQDVCWGTTRERAKEASDSTFFYTNSSLQHHNFNGDEWNQLEDWVLERVTAAAPRLCVLTGQFLTPADPLTEVNPGVSVRIPTAFWKVIVLRDPTANGDDLTAAAFIMPQSEEFMRTLAGQDAPVWPKEKLKTFQVEIADLEQLSRLDFGDLRNVDDFPWSAVRFRAEKMWEAWRPIEEPEDITLGGTRRRRVGGGRALRVLSNRAPAVPVTIIGEPVGDVVRGLAQSPAAVSHDCGCGDAEPVARRVAKLEHKLEQLADVIQQYARQKIDEADEIADKVKTTATRPPVAFSSGAGPTLDLPDGTTVTGAAEISVHALDILAEQSRRDHGRAEELYLNAARIVGGTRSVTGEFPSCVLIGDDSRFYCTGVLIAERLVLTAAHCGRDTTRMLAGVVDQGLAAVSSAQQRSVVRALRHADYRESRLPWNDLMLLILDQPIVPSDLVQVVPLMDRSELQDFNQEVVIVGFGNNDADSTRGFGRQRKALVRVADTFNAGSTTPAQLREIQRTKGFSAPNEFFAGADNSGIDTCEGDSGGPVYVRVGNAWKLLGITSRPAEGFDVLCGDGGLYVSVPYYTDWIQEMRTRYQV